MNLITIFYMSATLRYWICSGCISRTIFIKMTACVMCAKPGTYLLPHYMNNSMTIVSVDFLVVLSIFAPFTFILCFTCLSVFWQTKVFITARSVHARIELLQ